MFRVQNNVPDVYIEQSRDFQLFGRLYDCLQGTVNSSIVTMTNTLDPMVATESMLELLATRVGFEFNSQIDANVLRHIISAFPYLIKHKGSKRGIEEAVYTILKAEKDARSCEEVIVEFSSDNSVVNIKTQNKIYNKQALNEVLKYILPFGYTTSLSSYVAVDDLSTPMAVKSTATGQTVRIDDGGASMFSLTRDETSGELKIEGLKGAYDTQVIAGKQAVEDLHKILTQENEDES